MESGNTISGNSTKLRIGNTISASAGSGRVAAAPLAAEFVAWSTWMSSGAVMAFLCGLKSCRDG